MYLITKITPTKKIGFNNIYIDRLYTFTVSDFTLALFKLKENLTLQENQIIEILTTELTERFKNYSLASLSSRPKSEKEIENKLSERAKKYKETWPIFGKLKVNSEQLAVSDTPFQNPSLTSQQNICLDAKVIEKIISTAKENAIEFLRKYNYLNNTNFANWLTEQRTNQGKGKLYIKQDLIKKGVSREVINTVLSNVNSKDVLTDLYKKALKKYSTEKDKYKKKQKIYRYLLSKGFSYEEINSLVIVVDND